MKVLITLFIISLTFSCIKNKTDKLDFLQGTWKIEKQEQYEVWQKNESNNYIGYSYKISDNKKNITETLLIKKIDNQYIFEATVPDQNEGETVQFFLNAEVDSLFSFENEKHDFPKKIQYKKINGSTIMVSVLGDSNKGFSYIQTKK